MHLTPVRPRWTAVASCGASRHPAPAGLAFWAIATFAVTLSSAMAQISYLDNGVVLVYLRTAGFSPAIMQLPIVTE